MLKLNYYHKSASDRKPIDVDGTIEDVMRDIASRYSIPLESLEYTREIIIQSTWEDVTTYEDMWYVGKRWWGKLIEDPGVEKPHRNEERATSFGYIFKKKEDKSE